MKAVLGCRVLTAAILSTALLASREAVGQSRGDPVRPWLASLRSPNFATRLEAAYAFAGLGPAATAALLPALRDRDPFVRRSAAAALGEIGAAPHIAAPALAAALSDPDDAVRAQAAVALSKLGEPAVPALIAVLRRGMGDVSQDDEKLVLKADCSPVEIYRPSLAAALALAKIGAPAVPALIETLRVPPRLRPSRKMRGYDRTLPMEPQPDENAYLYTVFSLRRIGPAAMSGLAAALSDADPPLHLHAALALARIRHDLKEAKSPAITELDPATESAAAILSETARKGSFEAGEAFKALGWIGPAAVPFLVTELQAEGSRRSALEALKELGTEARGAVPALIELAKRGGGESGEVTEALGGTGSEGAARVLMEGLGEKDYGEPAYALRRLGPAAVPELVKALDSGRHPAVVARILGELGPTAKPAVPALIRALRGAARKSAAAALGEIGPAAKSAVPALTAAVADPAMRTIAIRALGGIGPEARPAVPTLIAVASSSVEARAEVIEALGRIGHATNGALGLLLQALQSRTPGLRSWAIAALSAMGKEAAPAAPALVDAARHGETDAFYALANMGPAAEAVVPSLSNLLSSSDTEVRSLAAAALAFIDPSATAAIPILVRDCYDCVDALVAIGAPAVPSLIAVLRKDPSPRRRLAAVNALKEMGPVANSARPALEALLRDGDSKIRNAAADAIRALGGEPEQAMPALLTALYDQAAAEFMDDGLSEMVAMVRAPDLCRSDIARGAWWPVQPHLPDLPWPPPRFSAHDVLPRQLLGSDRTSLGAVYDRLAAALVAAGFEDSGLFHVPGGFAVVTRVERILQDGTSSPADRWIGGKGKPLNLLDYLGRLFLERPGQFRLIAFLITDQEGFESGRMELSEQASRQLSLSGGRVLPESLRGLPWKGRSCHVLVYHFEKKGGSALVFHPSALSTREHLSKAGLWGRLAR